LGAVSPATTIVSRARRPPRRHHRERHALERPLDVRDGAAAAAELRPEARERVRHAVAHADRVIDLPSVPRAAQAVDELHVLAARPGDLLRKRRGQRGLAAAREALGPADVVRIVVEPVHRVDVPR
jgi:hypothetical protein